ncbi:PWWP domain-containing DNA repair factor 3A [Pelodytes ibericus]
MSCRDYVFCKWRGRFWPAKILSRGNSDSKGFMNVEILCLDEQIYVKIKDTKPLEKSEVENIAAKIANKTKQTHTAIADLTYRKALRIALNILSQEDIDNSSTIATPMETDVTKQNMETASSVLSKQKEITNRRPVSQKSPKASEQKKTQAKIRKKCDMDTSTQEEMQSTGCSKTCRTSDLSTVDSSIEHAQLQDKGIKRARHCSVKSEGDNGTDVQSRNETVLFSTQANTPATGSRSLNAECSKGVLLGLPDKNCSAGKQCAVKETCKSNENAKGKIKQVKRKQNIQDTQIGGSREAVSKSQSESCNTDSERLVKQQGNKYRPLSMPDFEDERGQMSSDLSLDISSPENYALNHTWSTEDPDDDEDLPSVLLNQGPASIESGMFVWCKFQKYPYWPSVVKTVRRKERKASVLFVEESLSDHNSKTKGFVVSLHSLKHYDCTEKKQLLAKARENYGNSVDWCDAVISDYRIRVGCGSFSGSFTEYCTADISYPVRREVGRGKSIMQFPSVLFEAAGCETDVSPSKSQNNKKMLPDRARAARDRANERLVEFIVKTKQADSHLLDVLAGKKKSRWLKDFLASNHHMSCIDTYMEDEKQVELVVSYLQTLCEQVDYKAQKLMSKDRMRFILDVLLPEAVIFAISATDEIKYEKAEKKYLDGPSVSKRERHLFEEQILEKKKLQEFEKLGTKKVFD